MLMNKLIYLILCFSLSCLTAQKLYFPPLTGNTWETISPASLHWCEDKITPLYNFLEEENSKAFIVLKDGHIVLEKYFGTFQQDSLWYWASAGKTLTSFLIGKAQEEKLLTIEDKTSDYLGMAWTKEKLDQENKILIRHQITMTTGLDDGVTDNHCTDPDCLQYLADPGTRWAYHNAPYTLLEKVIEKASNTNINIYTQSKLKSKIGMDGFWFTVDHDNVYFSKARSMARFGLLMLNKAVWNTDTLLKDKKYVFDLTHTSQNINQSYGYLWWLNGQSSYMLPGLQFKFTGSFAPDAPKDMFAALGKNGQFLCIVPSLNLVMLRMGDPPTTNSEVPVIMLNQLWQKLNAVMCVSKTEEKTEIENIQLVRENNTIKIISSEPVEGIQLIDLSGKSLSLHQSSSTCYYFESRSYNPCILFLKIKVKNKFMYQKVII